MKKLFALLLALCMLCGVVSAGAEDATQEVELYGSKFKIPAELMLTESMVGVQLSYQMAWCENYELALFIRDYSILGKDLEEEPATEQILNVLYWYIDLGLDANQATNVAIGHELQDIGMPDGKPVACLDIGTSVSIGHTDDNYGFLIMISSETGKSSDEMMEIGKEVALSFQRDGEERSSADVHEADTTQEAAEVPVQYIIITGESANIRKGATTDAPVITTGYKGDTFPCLGESDGWYKIDVNGQTGYVNMGLAEIK